MASKTLNQCYRLQDKLFAEFDSALECKDKTAIARAWCEVVAMQRTIRGVPPLKAIDAKPKPRKVASSSVLLLENATEPIENAEVTEG